MKENNPVRNPVSFQRSGRSTACLNMHIEAKIEEKERREWGEMEKIQKEL